MFVGQYSHQLDTKNRLRFPAKFKAELGSRAFVMKGTDGCLFVLSEGEYQKLVEKVSSIPLFSKMQNAARQFLSSGIEVEEDNQGRFLLKTHLREFASIVKNVVFVGVGSRVEIWAEERWNEKFNVSADSYDEVISALSELGI